MEYCNGGSLSSIIEQPENIYGLQQSEFLLVLRHISNFKLNIKQQKINKNNHLINQLAE